MTSSSKYDEIREVILEHNSDLTKNISVDKEYLLNLMSYLPNHPNGIVTAEEHAENHSCSVCGTVDIETNVDLMFVIVSDAYLAAFSCLPARKRATYLTTLLDCSQPNHELTTEDLDDDTLDFLFAAQFIDIKPTEISEFIGIPITTKEGIYFLYRFLVSQDLKREFY